MSAEYIGTAHHEVAANATNTTTAATATKTPSAAPGGFGGSAISTVVVGLAAVVVSYFL